MYTSVNIVMLIHYIYIYPLTLYIYIIYIYNVYNTQMYVEPLRLLPDLKF